MTSAVQTQSQSVPLPVRGGLAVVVAVLANVVIVVGVNALGVAPEFRALTIPPVAFLSALGSGGATVVYRLIHRYVSDADRTFLRVGAAVLILSFVPDIALLAVDPAVTPLEVAVLVAMYVVVAAGSVGLLVYWRTG